MFIIMIFMTLGGAFCAMEENAFDGIEPSSRAQLKSVRFVADQGEGGQVSLHDVGPEVSVERDQTQERLERVADVKCCLRCYEVSEEQTCKGSMLRWLCLPKTSEQKKFKPAFWITAVGVSAGVVLIVLAFIFADIFGDSL